MKTILAAISGVAKAIGRAIKKCFIAIKNVLMIIFKPIAHFIFLIGKGIYTVFKYIILYLFIKPILFLYHYVVVPIGRGLRFLITRFYKYILLPPLRGIAFIAKKIGKFFVLLYHKIMIPIGHFFKVVFQAIWRFTCFIMRKIGFAIKWCFLKIYRFFKIIFTFIYRKILYPIGYVIYLFFKYIFLGFKYFFIYLWKGISWIFGKIFFGFKIIFKFIYKKILYPIGYVIYLFFKYIFLGFKYFFIYLWKGISWIFGKIFFGFKVIFKFIFYKILKPIGLFIYRYILRPIGRLLKFIFTKLYQFLVWLMDKLITTIEALAKWIWKGIKFLYQCISVFIVVTISGSISIVYTFIVYPFRILIENKAVGKKKRTSLLKRLFFNPYYLFIVIKERNTKHYIKFKEKHPDVAIFIQIKNIVAYIPALLYSIVLYPLNYFLILIFSI